MKTLWTILSFIGAALKRGNLLLGMYFMYQAHKAFQNPGYTYALFGFVFLLFWLHDESNERKRDLEKSLDSFKDEMRGKLVQLKLNLTPKE